MGFLSDGSITDPEYQLADFHVLGGDRCRDQAGACIIGCGVQHAFDGATDRAGVNQALHIRVGAIDITGQRLAIAVEINGEDDIRILMGHFHESGQFRNILVPDIGCSDLGKNLTDHLV